jgi:class 3 adenylate cyclase
MRNGNAMDRLKHLVVTIGAIGDRPSDNEDERLKHFCLVHMGALMSLGAAGWSCMSLYFGWYVQLMIAAVYVLLTGVNFMYFSLKKNFAVVRFNQLLISLLLPFLFQWTLGGFIASGATMLWALLALMGSLTFQDSKSSLRWLGVYLILTILSGLMDTFQSVRYVRISPELTTFFFTCNIFVVSATVFGLSIYFLAKKEETKTKLEEMTSLLKKLFGRYLSPEVTKSLIENPSAIELAGKRKKRKEVTILMTDLRGFTALSERLEPEQVVNMLNTYFEVMVEVALKHNGTIIEITGDSLLVIFGAPSEMPDRVERAIACAIEMQNSMVIVNEMNRSVDLPEVEMGIGINETEVILGSVGSSKRSKYAVVGSGVNMTSRIESYSVGGQILVSESVRKKVGDILRIDDHYEVMPKGAEKPLHIYDVGGISGTYNVALEQKTPSLALLIRSIPIRYMTLANTSADTIGRKGFIARLSLKEAEIAFEESLASLTNLKIHLADVDERLAAYDLYGKVGESVGDQRYLVRFTSIPSEVEAYFTAHLQYAKSSG